MRIDDVAVGGIDDVNGSSWAVGGADAGVENAAREITDQRNDRQVVNTKGVRQHIERSACARPAATGYGEDDVVGRFSHHDVADPLTAGEFHLAERFDSNGVGATAGPDLDCAGES